MSTVKKPRRFDTPPNIQTKSRIAFVLATELGEVAFEANQGAIDNLRHELTAAEQTLKLAPGLASRH